MVACNGRRVALSGTGKPGEAVAGIRFRARELTAVLHPSIPVHAPLVFDIIDCWNERSIGRCTYYVGAPDGRPYPSLPLNATEALERRRQRFQQSEPAPNAVTVPEEEINPVFPMTLDMRLPPRRGMSGRTTRIENEKPGLA